MSSGPSLSLSKGLPLAHLRGLAEVGIASSIWGLSTPPGPSDLEHPCRCGTVSEDVGSVIAPWGEVWPEL